MITLEKYLMESQNDSLLEEIFEICKKYQPKFNHSKWSLQSIKRPIDKKPFNAVALVKDNKFYNAIFYIKDDNIYLANVLGSFQNDLYIPNDKIEYVIKFLINNQRKFGDFDNIDELKKYIIYENIERSIK